MRKLVIFFSVICLFFSQMANSQTVTGIVTGADDAQPIPGVNISVKGTSLGTITDFNGHYTIETSNESAVLVFSFVGYKTIEKAVGSQTKIDVILETDSKGLEEVVVVGYGVQRKSDVTGSTSSLGEDDFNPGSVVSPSEMIQGKVAGLQVTVNGGEPGAGATVRIRGASSVRANQDPLYVVDGVALDINDASPSGASGVGGINGSAAKNPLNFLNPNDIASIDILKDASATAIYGSRGANGVILITTKKGQKGEGKLAYSGYGSVSKLPKKMDLLSAADYRNWFSTNGYTINDQGATTDWQDEVFRTAYTQSHNFSYSGGTENSNYYTSLGHMDQQGIVNRTGLNKLTGRVKIKQEFLDKRLTIDGGLSVSRTKDQRVPIAETGGFEGDVLLTALKSNPTFPIYNPDGTYFQASATTRNAVAMINLTNDNTQTDRVLGDIGVTFKIIEGLSYKLNLSVDHSNATRKVTQGDELTYLTNLGTADIANIELTSRLIENYLTYDTKFGTDQSLNVLIGHSYQTFQNLGYNLSVNNFTVKDVDYLANLGYGNFNEANVGSSKDESELQSFFTRLNYSFMGKYLLTATMRVDGSTKFGENNKYGYFPSVGIAWRLTEEEFIKNIDIFSNLKLRLGWGSTGNQEIPTKISQLSLGTSPDANYYMDGTAFLPGVTFNRTPNKDIKWETTTQTNIGLDFGFFNERLIGSIDYFNKTTRDLLLYTTSIAPAPTARVWGNTDAIVVNNGIELELTGIIVKNNDFSWTSSFNFSKIKNDVKDLPVERIQTGTASGAGLSGTNVQVIKNGYPLGTFWGKKFLGYDSDGNSLYKQDSNGEDVQEDLGSALPSFAFGWQNTFTYKGFDLSFFINGVQGNKVYNNTFNASIHVPGLFGGNNVTYDVANSEEGTTNTPEFSSRFIEDGSFIRLSNLTLGYTIPANSIKWVNNLKIYVTGTNLFLITNYKGYDPEVSTAATFDGIPSLGMDFTGYPKARTFQFGINVEF
ncbi:MAG: TonB-dependent receptor [Bacteroidales bacterium]|nr:TonB-dependent receptor [Bacteroidales bacterium]